MKTLGIIGGMSPASTVSYYQEINRLIHQAKGANYTAPLLIYSVEFEQIAQCQRNGDWHTAGQILAETAQKLEQVGVDAILLATNTMHKVAPAICQAISVPFLHIIDATAHAIVQKNIKKVALLGTQFVMQQDFYKQELAEHGISCLVPDELQQQEIHRIIFQELCVGQITPSAKSYYLNIIQQLKSQGAEGIILGCTEIGLLISQHDVDIPVFDTTLLHATLASQFILSENTP